MNLPRLKGIIRERNKNYIQCANAIGKSVATFNSKMNGRSTFDVEEFENLANFLEMSDSEKCEVYF